MNNRNCPNCDERDLIEYIGESVSKDFREADYWNVYLCHVCFTAFAIARRVRDEITGEKTPRKKPTSSKTKKSLWKKHSKQPSSNKHRKARVVTQNFR